MNALTAHAPIRTSIDEAMEARRHLDDAITVYGNNDTIMREGAIEAIADGRAAYWTMAQYHNARASDLPIALNAGISIAQVLEEAYADGRAFGREPALDTIVPLNFKAANALALAYARFGSWKDDEELLSRCLRNCRRVA